MTRIRNVLVLPAGTEIGLEVFHALKHCKEVRLFGAGQDRNNHATLLYPTYEIVPPCANPRWLTKLMKVCALHSIDYIIPAYDDMIVALAQNQEHLPPVITSPRLACEITRSKSETYKELEGLVRVPRVYAEGDVLDFPVFAKPDRGQGSAGVRIIRTPAENDFTKPGEIVCEYLPGDEYTVDCFTDREMGLMFCGPRIRHRMRNGISMRTSTDVRCDVRAEIRIMAETISSALGMRGAWFFQVKRAKDCKLCLLEVAPRISGSMAANRVLGVNFPLMSIFEFERQPLTALVTTRPVELDRALVNRYRHSIDFSHLYIDLDDTLILKGKVNLAALKLVYQCINDRKPVTLITRHAGSLHDTLQHHRLAGLFDTVLLIGKEDRKSQFITEPGAIFVDDSFAERLDVSTERGIPVFDCSMIEVLTEGTYTHEN